MTTDRRDRDELTDRDDLETLLHQCETDWVHSLVTESDPHRKGLAEAMTDVILAAGWVHWPHDCSFDEDPS